jgi:hypothetical protein
MQTLTGDGALTFADRQTINDNFAELAGSLGPSASAGRAPIWVDTVTGNNQTGDGSAEKPFATMAAAFAILQSRDTIYFRGKVREQLVAPLGVYGVKIIGADTNPRHDLAASWLAPTSPAATTPLLQLREQGWVLSNFLMQPHTDDVAVKLSRRENATLPDASHAMFLGMRFQGGLAHIENDGGVFNIVIDGCTFMLAAGAGGGGIISTNVSIALCYKWLIQRSHFLENVNHIVAPLKDSRVLDNTFAQATTAAIDLVNGEAPNVLLRNAFDIAADDFDPSGTPLVRGVTGDVWHSILTDAVETGLPA